MSLTRPLRVESNRECAAATTSHKAGFRREGCQWRSQFPVDRDPLLRLPSLELVKHKYATHSILLKYRVKTQHLTSFMLDYPGRASRPRFLPP